MGTTASAPGAGWRRLGEILLDRGVIDGRQLEHALARQHTFGLQLGKTLVRLDFLSDETLHEALGHQFGIPCLDLDAVPIDRTLARLVSRRYAVRHTVVPIGCSGATLTVAVEDPRARGAMEEIARLTGLAVELVTAPASAISRAWRRLYDGETSAGQSATGSPAGVAGSRADLAGGRGDELFGQVLRLALDRGASDLHLEMLPRGLSIRLRIDGVLRRPSLGTLQESLDRHAREVISRIKVLAALDIAERRRPQDGSFQIRVERDHRLAAVDLRVSVLPSYSGESVVVRVLDRSRAPKGLDDLDLSAAIADGLSAALRRTSGIFLVTGPTGSGKSTTLYACLTRLNTPEIRVLTAEDPIEYLYEGLSQSEVNPDVGNTFASYLRSFLRHDPEVIMVGEIRDQETAGMAFRAAQTGHLLLSTLHTNTAVAAVPRLVDLGIDASLIATSLIGVLSQRLARRICSTCRVTASPTGVACEALFGHSAPGMALYRGGGCAACEFTGYRGRLLVGELWIPDERDLTLVAGRAPLDAVRASAQRTIVSMADEAHERLRLGQTSVDELVRMLPYSAIVEHRTRYGATRAPGALA